MARTLLAVSCRQPLKPDDIPPNLLALGWQRVNSVTAERLGPDGRADAWVLADELVRAGDHKWVGRWSGGTAYPPRRLRAISDDGVAAMYAIEKAEAEGPYSTIWEDQHGVPRREGWTHMVRQKRDAWCCPTSDNRLLIVLQTPAEGSDRLRYQAYVDGKDIMHAGKPRQFTDPIEAMIEAEC